MFCPTSVPHLITTFSQIYSYITNSTVCVLKYPFVLFAYRLGLWKHKVLILHLLLQYANEFHFAIVRETFIERG